MDPIAPEVERTLNGKTLLFVDDEPVFLRSLLEGLASALPRLRMVTASDGAEALEVLANRAVDLVVTDLRMPGVDGFELLARLHNRTVPIPTIVVTAFGTVDFEWEVRSLGACAFLEKPLDIDRLLEQAAILLSHPERGTLRGITLRGFLRLLAAEKKRSLVRVVYKDRAGSVWLERGNLMGAEQETLLGHEALDEILSWPDEGALISLSGYYAPRDTTIQASVADLLGSSFDLAGHSSQSSDDSSQPSSSGNSVASLQPLMDLNGALSVCLLDMKKGVCLGRIGGSEDTEVEALASLELVDIKLALLARLGVHEVFEELAVRLTSTVQLLRPVPSHPSLVIYLEVDHYRCNLGLARVHLAEVISSL